METATYSLGGLRIASDFPLFGVHVCRKDAEQGSEVLIRCAPISEEVASATARFIDGHYSGKYNGREILLESVPVGRFLVREGQEILMELAPTSDHDEVRAYLLGAVFGALCHQRGITPLHASAIDVVHGCIAFVGASGAGKSTLVAALARRGHQVIGDDECFLQIGAGGQVLAWPGMNGIRLWRDARAALGFDGSGVQREIRGYDKYFVPINPPRNPTQPRLLRRIYQLHGIPDGSPELTRLYGGEAVEVLMQNVYPPSLADRLGCESDVFIACAEVARNIPVFRFSRSRNFANLGQATEILEKHLLELY
jgi:hypothetical protein